MLYRVIGLMSGSSLDGLDIAYVEFQERGGNWDYAIIHAACIPYSSEWASRLKGAVQLNAKDHACLHAEYGHHIGTMVNRFIEEHGLDFKVALISSHGHTSFHVPEKFTVQLGDGAAIAAETGLPVVSDLRAMDVALGGQGAPIVPMGEKLLFSDYRFFLNIGGIANISYIGENAFHAFDVCAANRVMNMISNNLGKEYDDGGMLASTGRVHEPLLEALQLLDYYKKSFPKSLDNAFGVETVYPLVQSHRISSEDALATYVEHISMQVAAAAQQILTRTGGLDSGNKILITGGGAFNQYLISRLQAHLSVHGLEVVVPDELTVNYKEALVMALLGVLRWREEETVLPFATGASRPSIGGALWMCTR